MINWQYRLFFASTAGVTAGSDGAAPAGGSEGQAPAGGGGTTTPASPAATPSSTGTSAGGDQNIRQLREQYERLKADHDPWTKIGADHTQVTTSYQAYQKIFEQSAELGEALGYSKEEVAEALAKDPVNVFRYLQSEYAKAAGNQEETEQDRIDRLVQEAVEARTAPLHEAENVRRTNEANNIFERHTMGLITDHLTKDGFKGNVAESKEADILMRITSELIKYDPTALAQLKNEGKTALIQKYFAEAVAMADQYYTTRFAREQANVAPRSGKPWEKGKAAAAGAAPAKGPTLDEMIDNPGIINKKYNAQV